MFGLWFSNVAMLGWLAAAALPLLIHLWNKRSYREMDWAAMQFLLSAIRKNSRRFRLEQWLLLALRTLWIVCLVLAVAGPQWQQTQSTSQVGQPTHRVMVIDGSYSMAYEVEGKSRFQEACDRVVRLVEGAAEGDGVSLVLMADRPQAIISDPSSDRQAVLEEIAALRLPHGGGDLAGAIGEVERIFAAAAEEHPRFTRREVYFFTDLGRASWGAAVAGSLADQLAQLSRRAGLVLVDVGQEVQPDNLAVTQLSADGAYPVSGGEVHLSASIKNFSRQELTRAVELLVDGRKVEQQQLTIAAGAERSVNFRHRMHAAGPHSVEVRLPADSLPVDDRRWLALNVKERLRVLCVTGNAESGDYRGEADYLLLALESQENRAVIAPVQAEVISDSRLAEVDLTAYDCVFFSNVSQFTADEAQLLAAYAEQGGGLVFFLGDRLLSETYNRELGDRTGVLPVRIIESAAFAPYVLDPLDYRHPILAPFRGNERAGLLVPQVYKYWKLRPLDDPGQVAMAFRESGDPAIVEQRVGLGITAVVAFPASPVSRDVVAQSPWTVMPRLPTFLPLVRELLAHVLSIQVAGVNSQVGEPLSGAVSASLSLEPLLIEAPTGESLPVASGKEAGGKWVYSGTDQSGIYTLREVGEKAPLGMFARNVNTSESDLARVSAADLPAALTAATELPASTAALPLSITERQQTSGLHRWLLGVVLGCLFLETLLAWHWTNRS